MNRSWLTSGKHPSGLCGAAISIAAKFHNFRRRPHEIMKVVHVCPETIRKGIKAFKDEDDTALMTI
jgi:transcription factor IIIB subunit 2